MRFLCAVRSSFSDKAIEAKGVQKVEPSMGRNTCKVTITPHCIHLNTVVNTTACIHSCGVQYGKRLGG